MADWTSGYVADIDYTFGYYSELNPERVALAFLNNGLAVPKFGAACELGFGQGLSINVHASASAVEWVGTDFNPSQTAFAQELASVTGSGARLYDDAFMDFAHRRDLPDFDYIGLHGIWSWISDENRAVIVDFVKRKLKVGGILFISYNTLPGWANFAPMRHLLTEHADVLGSEGRGIVSRIDNSLEFASRLLETNPTFSRANPQVPKLLKKISGQNRHYLAHEYFNRDWQPMHFATIAEWLGNAKVQYAGSANYIDHIDVLNFTSQQQKFLDEVPDHMFRETVKDFMVNQQFRKDYWVKGARNLNSLEKRKMLGNQKVILVKPRGDVALTIKSAIGEARLQDKIYDPVLDFLADHKCHSINEIYESVSGLGIGFGQTTQAIMVLSGSGAVAPVQDKQISQSVTKRVSALNEWIMNKSCGGNEISYLASPMTGGAVQVGRFNQLFLGQKNRSVKSTDEWAENVWKILDAQGQKLVIEGKALESSSENIAELKKRALDFESQTLPILKALGIA